VHIHDHHEGVTRNIERTQSVLLSTSQLAELQRKVFSSPSTARSYE